MFRPSPAPSTPRHGQKWQMKPTIDQLSPPPTCVRRAPVQQPEPKYSRPVENRRRSRVNHGRPPSRRLSIKVPQDNSLAREEAAAHRTRQKIERITEIHKESPWRGVNGHRRDFRPFRRCVARATLQGGGGRGQRRPSRYDRHEAKCILDLIRVVRDSIWLRSKAVALLFCEKSTDLKKLS